MCLFPLEDLRILIRLFSGNLLVCVIPAGEFESLHSVKWHPKDPDTVAVASDSNIYLMNVLDIANAFRGATITQGELSRASQVFSVQSVSSFIIFSVLLP